MLAFFFVGIIAGLIAHGYNHERVQGRTEMQRPERVCDLMQFLHRSLDEDPSTPVCQGESAVTGADGWMIDWDVNN